MFPADLSYDPRRPRFALAGLEPAAVAVEVFTTDNVYGIDAERAHTEGNRIVATGLTWAGGRQRAEGRIEVEITPAGRGVAHLVVHARHDEPIKAAKVVLHDLPAAALDAGWWHATSPPGFARRSGPGAPVLLRYPWPGEDPWPEWETPWGAAGGSGPHVCVSVRDAEVRPVRLYAHRPPWAAGAEVVEVVVEQDARRWGPAFESPPVRVAVVDGPGAVRTEFDAHLAHLERTHGLRPWEHRTDVPAWFDDIRLVVALHGCHWTGYVFNDYPAMADALAVVAEHLPGHRVLAYLPGWEGRYYHDYPTYAPSPLLGGAEGFAAFVGRARSLGVRVMPMFGVHGVHALRWPGWEAAALRSRNGRFPVRINSPDWDGDRSGEDDQVFCNPGDDRFRAHLLAEMTRVVDTYGVDGVFCDTTACWFNDPHAALLDGYRALVADLRDGRPELLVAGEGWFDAILPIFGVNQSWHGVDRAVRYPELLTRYGRAIGHLSTGAPGRGSTGVHELGWTTPASVTEPAPGHVPVLAVVDDTMRDHRDAVARLCAAASRR